MADPIILPPLPKVDYDAGWQRQYTADQMHAHAAAVSAADNAALRERLRVLEDALRDAGDAIEWMYQCTAPASDDVEAAIRAARAPLEHKRPEPDCRNCRYFRLAGGPWCDIRDRCISGSEYLQMPPVKLYRIQSKESP